MPLYDYHCDKCSNTEEIFQHKMKPRKQIKCKCGNMMRRIFSRVNTDLQENPRWSWALGVNVSQIEQARRLWPDEKINEKGQVLIRNRHHKLQFMKKRHPHFEELD